MRYFPWAPYVSVAERRARAARELGKLAKKGLKVQPVEIPGRVIATTFWGKGWCDHIESFHDFSNRLPRGRTYVRNGSVCHLDVKPGLVEAYVSGSSLYEVQVKIRRMSAPAWNSVKERCAGQISSAIDLLMGRFSDGVMGVVTDRETGMFPKPGGMEFSCSCPDWAEMCKHVAAVLYGVGARLDREPQLLFSLRGVDHEELLSAGAEAAVAASTRRGKGRRLEASAIPEVFGVELEEEKAPAAGRRPRAPGRRKRVAAKKRGGAKRRRH
ncbi:MAG: SWIM zinc finger family protein [Planctomycetota bacterium]